MNVYQITIPVYADSKEEAEKAQNTLYSFVDRYRERGIAVTGAKIAAALNMLDGNPFIKTHVDNFLTN